MSYKHEVIYDLYPNVVSYDDEAGAMDADGNPITIDEAALDAKVAEFVAAMPMKVLRKKRDALLVETDWWASGDLTMTAEQTAYRQALRDLPANSPNVAFDDDGNLTGVTWPVKP